MEMIVLPLLKSIAWIYVSVPRSVSLCIGSGLGRLLGFVKVRGRVVQENLKIAFPSDSEKQRNLFREFYRHFGNLIFEIIVVVGTLGSQSTLKKFIQKNSEIRGLENWEKARQAGKGVIFLANHVGNWEVMAATVAAQVGIDMMIVTKLLKPEWFHQAIEKGRASCGVRATYEPKTLRDVLAHLKKGGGVGFVLDQYAGPPIGVRVPVFNVPVGTHTAIALIAKRTGAAVVPLSNYRQDNGKFVVEMRPALEWKESDHPDKEIAVNTAYFSSEIEKDIYAHPAQWLWTHRRFKGDLSPLRESEWVEGRSRS